jgi:hypothetical protein
MKNILTLAVAVAAMALFASEQAAAQGYNNGYLFGTGVNQACCGSGGGARFTAPPYFAQFPPVYYSGIVRRPYGISPYAAPAGIEPVELRAIPAEVKPLTVRNPYMNNTQSASGPAMEVEADSADDAANKTTWTKNPHFDVIDSVAALAFFQTN